MHHDQPSGVAGSTENSAIITTPNTLADHTHKPRARARLHARQPAALGASSAKSRRASTRRMPAPTRLCIFVTSHRNPVPPWPSPHLRPAALLHLCPRAPAPLLLRAAPPILKPGSSSTSAGACHAVGRQRGSPRRAALPPVRAVSARSTTTMARFPTSEPPLQCRGTHSRLPLFTPLILVLVVKGALPRGAAPASIGESWRRACMRRVEDGVSVVRSGEAGVYENGEGENEAARCEVGQENVEEEEEQRQEWRAGVGRERPGRGRRGGQSAGSLLACIGFPGSGFTEKESASESTLGPAATATTQVDMEGGRGRGRRGGQAGAQDVRPHFGHGDLGRFGGEGGGERRRGESEIEMGVFFRLGCEDGAKGLRQCAFAPPFDSPRTPRLNIVPNVGIWRCHSRG
ncbi:hypothetical protein B0H17DRAFT_1134744 [Mycena rosella]|uniref:Uncharacterized protein n=1 Tax=Mycena rosella TaxID=1033263 RepID=A0AAD7GHW1_MYCRO|nr:hypothetical protein B0H17DRAFT_1134744 [Mycena rosella]